MNLLNIKKKKKFFFIINLFCHENIKIIIFSNKFDASLNSPHQI